MPNQGFIAKAESRVSHKSRATTMLGGKMEEAVSTAGRTMLEVKNSYKSPQEQDLLEM